MKKRIPALLLTLVLSLGLCGSALAATHTVAPGDNLSKLARQYLGSSAKWKEIYDANRDILSDPGRIYVGQQLTIPGAQTAPSEQTEPLQILSVDANVQSDPYGKAIYSFTYHVNSTAGCGALSARDFYLEKCVYDGMEYHDVFSAYAKNVYVAKNSVTVEVEPFYPDMSFTREGYWTLTCTDKAFDLDAGSAVRYCDPVVDAMEETVVTHGGATIDCYLYTPEETEDMPLLVFNSGGSGISVTGDPYGANFAVSFAKAESQKSFPCYVLYPQRTAGETDDLCAGVKEIIDSLVAEGKVDADRIYMTGESAGSAFTMNFVSRYPGYCAAIAIFNGAGGEYRQAETLEEAVKIDASSPFSDAETRQLAESGTKVMLVQSLGDTTSPPMGYAATYQKLVNYGMKPGVEVVWHYYTAEAFNALLNDNTYWEATADAGYVTDPITGVTTYYYPEGKLHNSSYPAANDINIKLWLFDQSRAEYAAEFTDRYSALYNSTVTDYSVIPEKYTKFAVLDDVPCVPAGNKATVTVYTDDAESFYYIAFMTPFKPDMQYCEALVVNGVGRTVMDCSGTWWTNDINNSTMPYLLSLEHIDWQPYIR